ncbi:MFS transporter [Actinotignum sp. GS-2025b]|uniref:MFS transporter n=1 Tax=Actinotignum sp. GS-2025b TaxID=3427275 RepID=UPI003F45631D
MSVHKHAVSHPKKGKKSKIRIEVFMILWLIILLNYIDRTTLSIALPFIDKELGIDEDMQGWILSTFFWTYLIFQVPGGWLLDKFGPRRVIGAAGALWGGTQMVIGFIHTGLGFGVSRLLLGALEAPCAPSGSKLNSSWLPSGERARGATFVDMAGAFGSAVGGIMVTAIIGFFGSWRWAFYITGGITVIVAIIYYIWVRDTPEEHPRVSAEELEHIREGEVGQEGAELTAEEKAKLPRIVDYGRSTSWWAFWFGRLGWATVWWGLISWTPSYLSRARDFDLAGLGWGTFFMFMMGVVGQLVAGWLADWGRRTFNDYNKVMKALLVGSALGMAVCVAAIPFAPSGMTALFLLSGAVFFTNFGGLYWAIPAWLAPKSQVGTVGSVMNMASSLGGALAPIIMGYAIKAAGGSFTGAFVFLACAAGLYMIGSALINFNRPLAQRRVTA